MKNIPVLVGSRAANIRLGRQKLDYDFIGNLTAIKNIFDTIASADGTKRRYPTGPDYLLLETNNSIYEAQVAWTGSSTADIVEWVQKNTQLNGKSYYIAPFIILWLLKESHKYKDSIHFEKTRKDLLEFRYEARRDGIEFNEELLAILKKREAETYSPKVNLNVSKGEFFSGDGINYIIDHDKIHEHIATLHKPAYLFVKKSNSDVMCAKDLWDRAGPEIQYNCVIEEAKVISIERGMIPFGLLEGRKFTDEEINNLFKTALQKICTRLCSDWFREFAWENYDKITDKYFDIENMIGENYVEIFLSKLTSKDYL